MQQIGEKNTARERMTKSLAPPRLNVNVLIIKEFILENVNDVKARVVKFEWFGQQLCLSTTWSF